MPQWAKDRGNDEQIRNALTEQHAAADGKLARFVGIEAYQAAGGGVLRDLFEPDGAGFLTDVALLDQLAAEKLEAAAAPIRAEGWKWIEATPEVWWEQSQKDGRIQPNDKPATPERKAEADKLQTEADRIMAEHGEEPEDEGQLNRLMDLQDKIEALTAGEPSWTADQKAVAGVYVTIDYQGSLDVRRGIVKPEDKAAAKRLTQPVGQGDEADEATPPAKEKGGVPASLLAELTSHKTVAAQLTLAAQPAVALLAVTHALALRLLYPYSGNHTVLGISASTPTCPMSIREAVDASPAGKKLASVVKHMQKKLPKEPEQLWAWLAKQKPDTIEQVLAVCAALTVDLVQANGAKPQPAAAQLVSSIKLDMADHWEAGADNYFSRVPKKHLLAELGDTLTPNGRQQIEGMKREPAAKAMAAALKGKRWLPQPMQ